MRRSMTLARGAAAPATQEEPKKTTTLNRFINYVTGKKKTEEEVGEKIEVKMLKNDDENDDEIEPEEHYQEGGYHPLVIGDSFKPKRPGQIGRYIVIRKLGWGHFSTVWLAWDTEKDASSPSPIVALKIIKSASHYREAAEDEIELLEASLRSRGRPSSSKSTVLNHNDDENIVENDFIVTLLDHFIHIGPNGEHVCMVFEVLGNNLLKYLRCPKNLNVPSKHSPIGIPLRRVRNIMEQVLHGLNHLHNTSSIIHTDIKPENILLVLEKDELQELATTSLKNSLSLIKNNEKVKEALKKILCEREENLILNNLDDIKLCSQPSTPTKRSRTSSPGPRYVRVKIADLGNACWRDQHFTSDIQTRQYRSPEVILGLPYDTSCDIWSLACMAFELSTGDLLFDPRAHRGYGKCHDHLAQMIELLGRMPRAMATNGRSCREYFNASGQLKRIPHLNIWRLDSVLREKYYMDNLVDEDVKDFCNLLLDMLKFNPKERITASQALEDRFFKKNK